MIDIVVGGQFGSEGKGAIVAHLARTGEKGIVPTVVRVGGHNAGHTAFDDAGVPWALRTVPVGAVVGARCVIAKGSEVDERVLNDELVALAAGGHDIRGRFFIDSQTTVMGADEIATESTAGIVGRIGSTGKGVGAARASRIMRTAKLYDGVFAADTTAMLLRQLEAGTAYIIVEGVQGYGLGLHAGFYPTCTSCDCTAIDALAAVGISPWGVAAIGGPPTVYVVLRTHPIRVAGPSGPLFEETTWEALGAKSGGYIKPEKTTVTKKTRRVGGWDAKLAHRAIVANGGPAPNVVVALTFLDYIFPELSGKTDSSCLTPPMLDFIKKIETDAGAPVVLAGTGPNSVMNLWAKHEAAALEMVEV